jgi:hypothetical protein
MLTGADTARESLLSSFASQPGIMPTAKVWDQVVNKKEEETAGYHILSLHQAHEPHSHTCRVRRQQQAYPVRPSGGRCQGQLWCQGRREHGRHAGLPECDQLHTEWSTVRATWQVSQ